MDHSKNPLALFPTKKDVIRHNFVGLAKSKSLTLAVKEEDSSQQWLYPDKIDPSVSALLRINTRLLIQ